jgi:hypothetical protein
MPNFSLKANSGLHHQQQQVGRKSAPAPAQAQAPASAPAATSTSTPKEMQMPAGPDVPYVEGQLERVVRAAERNPLIGCGVLVLVGAWLTIRFKA